MLILSFVIFITCLSHALTAIIREDISYREPQLRESIIPIESRISKPLYLMDTDDHHYNQQNKQFPQGNYKQAINPHLLHPLRQEQMKLNPAIQPQMHTMGLTFNGNAMPTHHLRPNIIEPATLIKLPHLISIRDVPDAAEEASNDKEQIIAKVETKLKTTQKIFPRKSAELPINPLPQETIKIAENQNKVQNITVAFPNVTNTEIFIPKENVNIPNAEEKIVTPQKHANIKTSPPTITTVKVIQAVNPEAIAKQQVPSTTKPSTTTTTTAATTTTRPTISTTTRTTTTATTRPTATTTTTTTTTTLKPITTKVTENKSLKTVHSHYYQETSSYTMSTTAKPLKPKISFSPDDNPELFHMDRKQINKFKNAINVERTTADEIINSQMSTELLLDNSGRNNKRRYIIPIVAIIFALPLLLGFLNIATRRLRSYWYTRHYRRMDFLVDGMYNC